MGLVLSGYLLSAESALTIPAGVVVVAPGPVPVSGPLYHYYGPPLAEAPVYRGRFTGMAAGTLMDSGAIWTVDQFNPSDTSAPRTHYVEVTSGSLQGVLFDVAKTAGTTLTVDYAFGTASVVGSSYAIRPHRTLGGFLGLANQAGLRGGTEQTADMISLWDGTKYREFYYSTALPTGWRRVGDPTTDQARTIVKPTEGIFFRFVGGTSPALLLTGEMQTGPLSVVIVPGTNLVNAMAPVPMTLATSGLFTNDASTGVKAGAPTTADIVSLYNGTAFEDYYVRSTATGVQGWRRAGDVATDRSAVVIPPGTAFIVKRTGDPRPFVWKRPSFYSPPSS